MLIEIIKYIIFGLVQGITEPLPISSSGHLVVLRYLLNTDAFDDLTFEILLNFASFMAIFFIFRKDIMRLIKSFVTFIFDHEKREDEKIRSDFRYAWLIVLGSVPAAIGGVLFKSLIESKLDNIKILGLNFLITALMLFIVRKMEGTKKDKDLGVGDAIIIGLFQLCALMPGISRSGAVLVGCLLRKLDRDTALRYAFMLYLPVSVGSLILSIPDLANISSTLIVPYALGFLVTLVATYYATVWFFDVVKKGQLAKFSVYLTLLGISILLFL